MSQLVRKHRPAVEAAAMREVELETLERAQRIEEERLSGTPDAILRAIMTDEQAAPMARVASAKLIRDGGPAPTVEAVKDLAVRFLARGFTREEIAILRPALDRQVREAETDMNAALERRQSPLGVQQYAREQAQEGIPADLGKPLPIRVPHQPSVGVPTSHAPK